MKYSAHQSTNLHAYPKTAPLHLRSSSADVRSACNYATTPPTGSKVSITTVTEYPFSSIVNFTIAIVGTPGVSANARKRPQPQPQANGHGHARGRQARQPSGGGSAAAAATFPLLLRIPTWSNMSDMVVSINGGW